MVTMMNDGDDRLPTLRSRGLWQADRFRNSIAMVNRCAPNESYVTIGSARAPGIFQNFVERARQFAGPLLRFRRRLLHPPLQ